ncbi:MAG: hypothetical protein LBQ73_11685 [Tannerellaceae bacterium]|jgi:hypothetical protein|nr:hypothetical protein [Tannerellaceae bacterium]
MKKINIISGLLLVYLLVMSVIGWPGNKPEPDYPQYFLVGGISLAVIFLLRFIQIQRFKARKKWNEEGKGEEKQE